MGFGLTKFVPYVSYVILILLVFLAVYRVQYAIYFLIPFFPFRVTYHTVETFPFGRRIIDLVFLAMFFGWFKQKDRKIRFTFSYIPIALLVFITFVGVINGFMNIDIGVSFLEDSRLRDWKNYVMMPAIYLLVVNNIKTKEAIKKSCLTMIVVVALQGLLFYRNFSDRSVEHFSYDMREGGTFAFLGANHLASFFVEYMVICLTLFFGLGKDDRWFRLLCGATVLLSTYAVMFLFSRGAYAGLLAAVAVYAIARKRVLIPFMVALVLFWQNILPVPVVERISSTMEEGNQEFETLGHRENIWKKSIEVYRENPVLGIGYRTFQFTTGKGELKDPHNMYLSVMAEMGTVGLIAFISVLLTAMGRGLMLYKSTDDPFFRSLGLGFFISAISVAVMNFFGDRWSYIMMQAFYWTIWGLVDKSIIISKEYSVKQHQ